MTRDSSVTRRLMPIASDRGSKGTEVKLLTRYQSGVATVHFPSARVRSSLVTLDRTFVILALLVSVFHRVGP